MNSANEIGPCSRIASRIASAPRSLMARSMPPSAPGRIRTWLTNFDWRRRSSPGATAPRGLELLVIERSRSSRFLPGYVAFPGGATDPGDADLAVEWFGTRGRDLAGVRDPRAVRGDGARADRRRPGTDRRMGPAQPRRDGAAGARPAPRDRPLDRARRRCRSASTRATTRWRRSTASSRRPMGPKPRLPGGRPRGTCWTITRPAAEALLAHVLHAARTWPTCASVADLLALRIETREPTDDDVERMPRATFWQD